MAIRDGVVDLAFAGVSSRAMPESILLDATRLAAAHVDLVDLGIVYALVLLGRQLGLRDVDVLKTELVALVADGSLGSPVGGGSVHAHAGLFSASAAPASAVGGLHKLGSERWRDTRLADALLHVAARVDGGVPNAATLELVRNWADRHIRLDAPLFVTLQARVRSAIVDLVQFGLDVWPRRSSASLPPLEAIVHTGIGPVQHGNVAALGVRPAAMASDRPRLSRKRSRSRSRSIDGVRKRRRSCSMDGTAAATLRASGLLPLETELRQVSERLAKVVAFHTRVYAAFYERLVHCDDAEVIPSAPSSPLVAVFLAAR